MDTLLRLVWATPLVLLTGVALMLGLKQILTPRSEKEARRMAMRESLSVSDGTKVHLIEIDNQNYVLVESPGGTVLQQVKTAKAPAAGPLWARHLLKIGSR